MDSAVGHPGGGHQGARRYAGGAARLRSPERVALLDPPHVAALSLEGVAAPRSGEEAPAILDIGTGTGLFAETFAAKGYATTGIDSNPELLDLARGLVPGVTFIEASAEHLPFDDASFELVFLGQLLHEVEEPLAVLLEAHRVAKGRVAVLEWPWREDKGQGPSLEHRLEPARVEGLAREAGFRKVSSPALAHMALYLLES